MSVVPNARGLFISPSDRRENATSYVKRVSSYVGSGYLVSTISSFNRVYSTRDIHGDSIVGLTSGQLEKSMNKISKIIKKREDEILKSQASVLGLSIERFINFLNDVASAQMQKEVTSSIRLAHSDILKANIKEDFGSHKMMDRYLEDQIRAEKNWTQRSLDTAKKQIALRNSLKDLIVLINNMLYDITSPNTKVKGNPKIMVDALARGLEDLKSLASQNDIDIPTNIGSYIDIPTSSPLSRLGQSTGYLTEMLAIYSFLTINEDLIKELRSKYKIDADKLDKAIESVVVESLGGNSAVNKTVDMSLSFTTNADVPPLSIDIKTGSKNQKNYTMSLSVDIRGAFKDLVNKLPKEIKNSYLTILMNFYVYSDELYLTGDEETAIARYLLEQEFSNHFENAQGEYPTLVLVSQQYIRFSEAIKYFAEHTYKFSGYSNSSTFHKKNTKDKSMLSFGSSSVRNFIDVEYMYLQKRKGWVTPGRSRSYFIREMKSASTSILNDLASGKQPNKMSLNINLKK